MLRSTRSIRNSKSLGRLPVWFQWNRTRGRLVVDENVGK